MFSPYLWLLQIPLLKTQLWFINWLLRSIQRRQKFCLLLFCYIFWMRYIHLIISHWHWKLKRHIACHIWLIRLCFICKNLIFILLVCLTRLCQCFGLFVLLMGIICKVHYTTLNTIFRLKSKPLTWGCSLVCNLLRNFLLLLLSLITCQLLKVHLLSLLLLISLVLWLHVFKLCGAKFFLYIFKS